jgi:protein ImuB
MIDLTGCAHLFGGEAALFAQVGQDCADLGLSVRRASPTRWARPGRWRGMRAAGGLARARSGDAIDQEARATRSRAAKRHWTKGGAAPARGRHSGDRPDRAARPDPAGAGAAAGRRAAPPPDT